MTSYERTHYVNIRRQQLYISRLLFSHESNDRSYKWWEIFVVQAISTFQFAVCWVDFCNPCTRQQYTRTFPFVNLCFHRSNPLFQPAKVSWIIVKRWCLFRYDWNNPNCQTSSHRIVSSVLPRLRWLLHSCSCTLWMRQIYSEFVFLKHTLNEYLARFQLSPKLQPHTNPTTLLSLSSSIVTCDRSENKARGLNYHVPKFKPTDVALLDTSSSRSHPREVRVSSPPWTARPARKRKRNNAQRNRRRTTSTKLNAIAR